MNTSLKELIAQSRQYLKISDLISANTEYRSGDRHFKECIADLPDETLYLLQDEISSYNSSIRDIRSHNDKIYQQCIPIVEDFCKSVGLSTWKKSSGGKIIGEYSEFKNILKSLRHKVCGYSHPADISIYRVVFNGNPIKISGCCSPINAIEAAAFIRRSREAREESIKQELDDYKYCAENGLLDQITADKSASIVAHEHAKQLFEKEHLKEGTELSIDCCSECDCYTIGDRRCFCGNVRVQAYVEGSRKNGFYINTERY